MIPTPSQSANRKSALRVLKVVLFIAVLTWVSSELLDRLQTDALSSVRLDWRFLLSGGLFGLLSLALFALVYRQAQSLVQPDAGWLPAVLVAWISPLGKYLPGKVASLLGAMWIYRENGVSVSVGASALLLSTASGFFACSVLVLPMLVMDWSWEDPSRVKSLLALIVLAIGLAFAYPRLFIVVFNYLLARAGRSPISVNLPFGRYLGLTLISVVQLGVTGAAFWLVTNSVASIGWSDLYRLTAAYTVAGVMGMLAVFAPGGLGVREGLLLLFLDSAMDEHALALAVILMRASLIVCEAFLALAGLALWRLVRLRRQGGGLD
jgi:uncharacterized membrane protein YbhN (UPF0104 family)